MWGKTEALAGMRMAEVPFADDIVSRVWNKGGTWLGARMAEREIVLRLDGYFLTRPDGGTEHNVDFLQESGG